MTFGTCWTARRTGSRRSRRRAGRRDPHGRPPAPPPPGRGRVHRARGRRRRRPRRRGTSSATSPDVEQPNDHARPRRREVAGGTPGRTRPARRPAPPSSTPTRTTPSTCGSSTWRPSPSATAWRSWGGRRSGFRNSPRKPISPREGISYSSRRVPNRY